ALLVACLHPSGRQRQPRGGRGPRRENVELVVRVVERAEVVVVAAVVRGEPVVTLGQLTGPKRAAAAAAAQSDRAHGLAVGRDGDSPGRGAPGERGHVDADALLLLLAGGDRDGRGRQGGGRGGREIGDPARLVPGRIGVEP